MPLQRVHRMARRSPWLLGLHRQQQVQPVLEFMRDMLGLKDKQVGGRGGASRARSAKFMWI